MRHPLTSLCVVIAVLAITAASASAAKPPPPPPPGLNAGLAITSTDSSTNTCSGTLTVSWNGGKGKRASSINSVNWSADPSSSGTLTFAFGGIRFAAPQLSGTWTVGFTLTSGTGQADISVVGPGFVSQVASNTVSCDATPDLTITGIALTAPAGFAPPWSYTVTVKNIGTGTADVANVLVQGYYTGSTDTTMFPPLGGVPLLPGDDPACGIVMQPYATTLAPGASVDVYVGCGPNGPTIPADTNLMVGVNLPSAIAESNVGNNVAVVPLATA